MNNQLLQAMGPLLAPIKSVSIAFPAVPGSEGVMTICYNTGEDFGLPVQGNEVKLTGWSKMADTYIRVKIGWENPLDVEKMVSELGWYLGGGYMYRWIFGPGAERHKHRFGCQRYEVMGDSLAIGEAAPDLLAMAQEHGVWEWEINSAYLMRIGINHFFWTKWKSEDNFRNEDGLRGSPFPGWAGGHRWHPVPEEGHGIESCFFYTMPKKLNKRCDVLVNGL